jgi:hypothetical protein
MTGQQGTIVPGLTISKIAKIGIGGEWSDTMPSDHFSRRASLCGPAVGRLEHPHLSISFSLLNRDDQS